MDIQNVGSNSNPPGTATAGTGSSAPVSNAETSSAAASVQKKTVNAKPSHAELQSAVDNINKAFKQNGSDVQFSIDPFTKERVMKMVDSSTGQVISQYPSATALAISSAISQEMKQGVLINQKA